MNNDLVPMVWDDIVDKNKHFKVVEYRRGNCVIKAYVLNPGDHFEGFAGSDRGLTVTQTPSLIVRFEYDHGELRDLETDVNDIAIWRSLFRRGYPTKAWTPTKGKEHERE